MEAELPREEDTIQKKKRKRAEEKALAKIKESKSFKRHKKANADGSGGDDEDVAWDMYTKKAPLPGQLENCELCDKRFTVTAYSKTGPDGGLLCTKCSKEQEAQKKKDQKPKKQAARGRVRQIQSNLLDGIIQEGSKSLMELCIRVGEVDFLLTSMLTPIRKWPTTFIISMSLAISPRPYSID